MCAWFTGSVLLVLDSSGQAPTSRELARLHITGISSKQVLRIRAKHGSKKQISISFQCVSNINDTE